VRRGLASEIQQLSALSADISAGPRKPAVLDRASAASGGAACIACGGLVGVAMGAGGDIADDYCD
jgi:hypothetical protein